MNNVYAYLSRSSLIIPWFSETHKKVFWSLGRFFTKKRQENDPLLLENKKLDATKNCEFRRVEIMYLRQSSQMHFWWHPPDLFPKHYQHFFFFFHANVYWYSEIRLDKKWTKWWLKFIHSFNSAFLNGDSTCSVTMYIGQKWTKWWTKVYSIVQFSVPEWRLDLFRNNVYSGPMKRKYLYVRFFTAKYGLKLGRYRTVQKFSSRPPWRAFMLH